VQPRADMTDPNQEVQLEIGKRVIIFGKRKGTVRFIGTTEFGEGKIPYPLRTATFRS